MFNPTIVMGIELEVEIKNDPEPHAEWLSKHNIYGSWPKHHLMGNTHHKHGNIAKAVDQTCEDMITTHYDNTINDGFEFIGEAMNVKDNKKYWKLLLEHKDIAPYIHGDDVKPSQGQYSIHDVGMHVHVSGDPITPLILGKVFMFINAKGNREFMQTIAGRKFNQFCETQPGQKITSVTSLYHSLDCPKRTKRGTKIKYNLNGTWDWLSPSSGTYCCGNSKRLAAALFHRGAMWVSPALNAGDYEVRIFKSTTQVDKFYTNLEFCLSTIDFAHQVGIGQLTVKDFGTWIELSNNRIKYPYLFRFLRTSGYVKGIIPKSTTLSSWSLPVVRVVQ